LEKKHASGVDGRVRGFRGKKKKRRRSVSGGAGKKALGHSLGGRSGTGRKKITFEIPTEMP